MDLLNVFFPVSEYIVAVRGEVQSLSLCREALGVVAFWPPPLQFCATRVRFRRHRSVTRTPATAYCVLYCTQCYAVRIHLPSEVGNSRPRDHAPPGTNSSLLASQGFPPTGWRDEGDTKDASFGCLFVFTVVE